MKKNNSLTWSLIAALCLMVVISGVLLLKSYNSTKTNQSSMLELEVIVSNLMDELDRTKSLAAEKETELETQNAAYQQQLSEMQLVLNNTMDDRDTLTAQVQSMNNEAAKAAENLEALQNLKLQYFGHLMRRADSLEKTLMLGGIEGRRRGDRKSTRLNSSHTDSSRMPSSA